MKSKSKDTPSKKFLGVVFDSSYNLNRTMGRSISGSIRRARNAVKEIKKTWSIY